MTDNNGFFDNWPTKPTKWDPVPEPKPLDLDAEYKAKIEAALTPVEPNSKVAEEDPDVAFSLKQAAKAETEAEQQEWLEEAARIKAADPKAAWLAQARADAAPNRLSDAAIISFVLDLPDHVPPNFWQADIELDGDLGTAWAGIKAYHQQCEVVPTREVLLDLLGREFIHKDDQTYDRWVQLEKSINRKSDPRETPYIKGKLAEWTAEKAKRSVSSRLHKAVGQLVDALPTSADEQPATEILMRHLQEAQDVLTGRDTNGEQTKYSFRDLASQFPKLRPVVMDGILREGEVANIISYSKIGKSWLVYGLALSVMTGRPWFGKFQTTQGRVLLVDNELHRETIAFRIHKVADAMGIRFEEYADQLEVWALRGKGKTISTLRDDFMAIEPREYKLIVLDAKYRFMESDNENDNAGDTKFYNLVDEYSEHTLASLVLIHHASKGDQSEKRITDVGAGAGAQSRAADGHLVLRELGTDGAVAMDAAIRSFPPMERLGLRWEFPLWVADEQLDTTLASGQNKHTNQRDSDGRAQIMQLLAKEGKATMKQIRKVTGMGADRAGKLIYQLEQAEEIESRPTEVAGNPCQEYVVRQGGLPEQTG